MAWGNKIVVTVNPKGTFLDGIVSGTPKPGTVMQVAAATEPQNGRHTWVVFGATDGNQRLIAVLLEQFLLGGVQTTAFVSGDRIQLYCPVPGEELNMLCKNIGGTATGSGDDFAIGDPLIVDGGTGKLIATTGTPESEPFIVLETISEIVEDTLVWCMFSCY